MKFSCEKSLLSSAISITSRATASRSPIPSLEGLLIEAGKNVIITGYDLKKGIYTSFEADVESAGSIVLSARLFGDIVRSLSGDTVVIEASENNTVIIKCGRSEFTIVGTEARDYPDLPLVEGSDYIEIKQKTLKGMINDTIFAVSDNESRPIYTGSLFEIEGDNLTVVAVDGFRLALRKEKIEERDNDSKSFVVPGQSLSELEKLCSDVDKMVKIIVGDKHISFIIGETVLISRRLEGEFLNYKKSIPSDLENRVKINRTELMQAVDRVSLIIDDRTKNPLRVKMGSGNIMLSCMTALGKADDICPCEGEGSDMEIGFNNRYIRDALRAAPAEKLQMNFKNAISPVVFTPLDGDEKDSFIYMVLPVRLKTGE